MHDIFGTSHVQERAKTRRQYEERVRGPGKFEGEPGVRWPGKATLTFSDELAAVRRWLWAEWVFPQAQGAAAVEKLPPPLREIILSALAPAA